MKRTFHLAGTLLRLAFLAALGFAIFSGGAYLYAHGVKIIISPLEIISPSLRFHLKIDWKTPLVIEEYTGPQSAQELMKALDADYNKGHGKTEVRLSRKDNGIETESYSSNLTISEIDARYPRAEWLQLLLERGIIIGDLYEYGSNLSHRHALAFLEDNPNLWESGVIDIPPTDDWETYKAAYIDMLVDIEGTKAEVERRKPEIERTKAEVERTIERIKVQVERAKVQIKQSKKDVERAQNQLNSQQLEDVRKQLEDVRKQIARVQETLEHLKEPTPAQK
ncbi:hypothetical protein F4Z99_16070 [Candidatus Poribacteria bacterium]|nr:hypothetical protein [Candidatus Poribacteria bacterium]MYA99962.1 hypothetical protein [Candidatus Poribacteria bacterium]